MSKIIKNIPVFILWLAGLATIAHLIIPHDHHMVESTADQEESCPFSNSTTSQHSGFPVHCHAFNEFSSERLITFILKRVVQSNDLSFSSFSGSVGFILKIAQIPIPDIMDPFHAPYLLEISLLRAPPSIS